MSVWVSSTLLTLLCQPLPARANDTQQLLGNCQRLYGDYAPELQVFCQERQDFRLVGATMPANIGLY